MKHIVVGVDRSPSSERALDRALLEAERTSCLLRVVHVWSTPAWMGSGQLGGFAVPAPPLEDSRNLAHDTVDEILTKALDRRTSAGLVQVIAEVEEGDPARVLSRMSAEASLVVVGGSGHGQLAGALLASATTYVLHHAHCPVMVVPNATKVVPVTRVVVGVDGSASSRAAVRWAQAAATARGCPLVAVHAWTVGPSFAPRAYDDLPTAGTHEQDAQVWLDAELTQLLPADESTVLRLTPYGYAAGTLIDEAGPADLLVVGSRGHGGFTSLLLGSVAIQAATHAHSSVVVVKESPAASS